MAWVVWFGVLLLSAYVVPFAFLGHVPRVWGAFLFWCLFALAAIVSMNVLMRRWRDVA
ncbi:MAG: hypothetical protein AB1816_12635 [Bacillota bacterium]